MTRSAHIDSFARDHLPPREQWPEFRFDLPELQFPESLNCVSELLDRRVREGEGDRLCVQGHGVRWTYAELQAQVNGESHRIELVNNFEARVGPKVVDARNVEQVIEGKLVPAKLCYFVQIGCVDR